MKKLKDFLNYINYYKQGTPYISLSLTACGMALFYHSKLNKSTKKNAFKKIKDALFIKEGEDIPILPKQQVPKPVVLFNPEDFLFKPKFNFLSFKFVSQPRIFSDVFLFHMAHLYELISISDMPVNVGEKLINSIDPYGCISYRLFIRNTHLFNEKHLNRPKDHLVVLSTGINTIHPDFKNHTINIPKWKGECDDFLLNMLNFFTNLYFSNLSSWKDTISSYKNKNFVETYEKIQKKLFRNRNFLSLNLDRDYKEKIWDINSERINEYKKAKIIMDQNIDNTGDMVDEYFTMKNVFKFIRSIIF
ncbi:Mitochondrial import inner membrane translocase subunit TIM50-B [Astathelohania contejeani]|uniref:Mitochondrial import inner membrane translocase subunit TIM50-B n=1 Tax=Astathelohania contejeani TaxID=164912 RepID=A0ABQ7I1Y7_9MICR|nr:Mitochondrial import inner membrane translocase subunit TIM50-B [Thelohania contejeani]